MIIRHAQKEVDRWLFKGKVIILYGARQVGKTTLCKHILDTYDSKPAYYNCEIQSVKDALATKEPQQLRKFVGNYKVIVLDEAQNIPDIGAILKLLIDTYPDLQIIATGSSSFELANATGEALTGRAVQITMYPISWAELSSVYNAFERQALLPKILQYGLYPDIVTRSDDEAQQLLNELSNRYLYKDIFEFENVRRSDLIHKLLQLLAFQIGNEVSLNEIANTLGINRRTVERYIDLLEKTFVIFRLTSFSRNLRKEINKGFKIYFHDLGIRNSIIQQFQPIDIRNDKGGLWENFLICERMKYLQNHSMTPAQYFWRTHDQQELDYIEEYNGQLSGYEFKWKLRKQKAPKAFVNAYPDATVDFIDTANFEEWVEE